MIFGYIDYVITGDSFTKFFRRIMSDKLPVSKMCEKNGKLTLRMPAEHCKALERLCDELGLEYTATKRHGSFVLAKRFFGRGGLVIGTAAVMLSCFYLSNVVVRFDILSDDENIRKDVMSVLKEEGVETGTYIPSIDLIVTERALKQKVEGISWAGITRKGDTLIIDVIETEGDTKRESNRYPSNLVACENGVIEKVEVYDGQLKIPVGSGVTKETVNLIIEAITFLPCGVISRTRENVEMVQTSSNIGSMTIQDGTLEFLCSGRSSVKLEKAQLKEKMQILSKALEMNCTFHGDYPQWEYRKESKLRDICAKTYREYSGKDAVFTGIHAGIECGYLAEKLGDHIDMISCGANLYDVHTPHEKADVESFYRMEEVIIAILQEIAKA